MRRYCGCINCKPCGSFNPLFIGSKDATAFLPGSQCAPTVVSIPFSSGQRMRPPSFSCGRVGKAVSIPFSSGQRMRLAPTWSPGERSSSRFNPLFIGSKDATIRARVREIEQQITFQSPFHRVKGCDPGAHWVDVVIYSRFNPLFIGSKDATLTPARLSGKRRKVSIPFSSGQRMRRLQC